MWRLTQLWLKRKEKEEWLTRHPGKGKSANYAKGIKGSFSGPSSGQTACDSLLRGNRTPTSPPMYPTALGQHTHSTEGLQPSFPKPPHPPTSSCGRHPPFGNALIFFGPLPNIDFASAGPISPLLAGERFAVSEAKRPRRPREAIFFGRSRGSGRVRPPHHALSIGARAECSAADDHSALTSGTEGSGRGWPHSPKAPRVD